MELIKTTWEGEGEGEEEREGEGLLQQHTGNFHPLEER